jgi:hypothetical protein
LRTAVSACQALREKEHKVFLQDRDDLFFTVMLSLHGFGSVLTSSPKTGPEKFEFSGGRSSPKKEENRDEKETQ